MKSRTFLCNFSGGEVSPGIAARPDLDKYRSCCLTLRNMVSRRLGEACNRPGLQHCATLPTLSAPPRLIPFQYNTDTGYVLVAMAGTWRILDADGNWIASGGNPIEISTPYTAAMLPEIRHAQNADVLFTACAGTLPRMFKRYSATDWRLENFDFTPVLSPPASLTATPTNAGGSSYKILYKVSVVDAAGNESEPSGAAATAIATPWGSTTSIEATWTPFTDATQAANSTFFLAATAKTFTSGTTTYLVNTPTDLPGYGKATMNSTEAMPAVSLVISGTDPLGKAQTETIACSGLTSITSAGNYRSINYMRIYNGGSTFARTVSAGHAVLSIANGTYSYKIYKNDTCGADHTGGWYGFIGTAKTNKFTDRNIAPSLTQQPLTFANPFDGVGNLPAAVSVFQQRLWFGRMDYDPQRLIASRATTLYDWSKGDATTAADPLDLSIDDAYPDKIQHLVPMRDMLALTAGAVWTLTGGEGGIDAVKNKTVLQSREGSGTVRPCATGNAVLYASRDAKRLLAIGYKYESDGYVAEDLTVLAEHLFRDDTIKEMALSSSPDPILWIVTGSGKLLSLTFRRDQAVCAFSRHDSGNGIFESVAITTNASGADTVWLAVRRSKTDNTEIRTVERLAVRTDSHTAGVYLDCSKTIANSPASATVSGLDHLNGFSVTALADGVVRANLAVANGIITLPAAASTIVAGIPYVADLQTVPMSSYGQSADAGLGRKHTIDQVAVRCRATAGGLAGSSFDRLAPIPWDSALATAAPGTRSGVRNVTPASAWNDEATVCIRQDKPQPMTVESIAVTCTEGEK